ATVSIQNFQPGNEILTFTTQAPVTGTFDNATGILTFTGGATMAIYETILRTVTYAYSGPNPGGRQGNSGKTKSLSRTISFSVFDQDFTTPIPAIRTLTIVGSNAAPTITVNTIVTVIKGSTSIDLSTLVVDADGNFDASAAGAFGILAQPQSGATATISGSILSIDYSQIDFSGSDTMQIEVCDLLGACTQATINIEVEGDIIIRNGISPNGDGLNDFLKLENIVSLGPNNRVTIFTRWGDKVFEIENYDNLTRRFEGKSNSGKELTSGVYFYKIEFTNGRPELTGYLTIKR
ncbi:MAG: gliding motility-associated C-terminal domain-containing protein, partial [Cyclobacteriaceae bacterium]